MRIAYLSTDEMNQALAATMAQAHRVTLCLVEPRDASPGAEIDALLYDWDFWHVEGRDELLAQLLAGVAHCPVVLHGHNVGDDQADALRRQGIGVYRALQPAVFQHLRQAVLAFRVAALTERRPFGADAG
jgi:hypothetical protein